MPHRPPTHKPLPVRVWRDPKLNLPLEQPHRWRRGYDKDWERFRRRFLATHPFCRDCLANGQTTAAKDVHHILRLRDHPLLRLDQRNCMALCHACHADRTNRGE